MKQISFFCLSLFLSISLSAQQISKKDELFVDSIMRANYKPTDPGAVILIAKKGEPIFRKSYGLANMELNISNKPENVFCIGSMTKQFTAVCILKLAQAAKLNLQDDIKKYLPNYNSHGRIIKIENLLYQTSGIPSYTELENYEPKRTLYQTKKELLNSFMNDSLLFEPDTDWSYSNSNYILAAMIIENISGLSLAEYYQQNIFTPLGMSHTCLRNFDSIISNAANGYTNADEGKYRPAVYESCSWDLGAGGICSTVDDLLKWDNTLYTDKIVKHEWLEKAWKSFMLPNGLDTHYGFGWGVTNYKDMQLIDHGGAAFGFLSDGLRIPSKELYIVILSNNEASAPSDISTALGMYFTEQIPTKATILHLNKKQLGEYAGVYTIHRIGARVATNFTNEKLYRSVTIMNDTLLSQAPGGPKEVLICIGKDLFLSEGNDARFQFNRNKKGNIESLETWFEPIAYGPNELEPKTTLPYPKEKKAITIDTKKLEQLEGKYNLGQGEFMKVTVSDNKIYIQETGEEKQEIFAESETNFFLQSVDVSIVFTKTDGEITGIILNEGSKTIGKKIE